MLVAYDDEFSPVLLSSERASFEPERVSDPDSVESWVIQETQLIYHRLPSRPRTSDIEEAESYAGSRVGRAWAKFSVSPAAFVPAHRRDTGAETPGVAGSCAHTYTGCTATATAQLMKYWNWPESGTGSRWRTPLE